MESKRSRTIVSTTITTEPSCAEDPSNVDALQGRISDHNRSFFYRARQTKSFSGYVARTNMSRRRSSRCRSLVHGPNTVGGVYLGLARAGDVVQLGERMQKELDDGLYTIEARFFPRTGRPDRFTEQWWPCSIRCR